MATRMRDTDRPTGTVEGRPKVWPWVVLAVVVALALWWVASAMYRTANEANYPNTTTPYGITPGGAGGTGGR